MWSLHKVSKQTVTLKELPVLFLALGQINVYISLNVGLSVLYVSKDRESMVPILHLLQGRTGVLGFGKVTTRAWQMGKGAGVTPGIQLARGERAESASVMGGGWGR